MLLACRHMSASMDQQLMLQGLNELNSIQTAVNQQQAHSARPAKIHKMLGLEHNQIEGDHTLTGVDGKGHGRQQ